MHETKYKIQMVEGLSMWFESEVGLTLTTSYFRPGEDFPVHTDRIILN